MISQLTGVVLAGGQSRRFGSNKALLDWNGTTLVEAVARSLRCLLPEVLVVTKDAGALGFLRGDGVRVIEDLLGDHHPLGGISAGLQGATTPHAFVCACDMPFLQPGLIEALWQARSDYAAVIPVWSGIRQPLCGIYATECSGMFRRALDDRASSIGALFDSVPTRFFLESEIRGVDPEGLSFMDIDTQEDLERAGKVRGC